MAGLDEGIYDHVMVSSVYTGGEASASAAIDLRGTAGGALSGAAAAFTELSGGEYRADISGLAPGSAYLLYISGNSSAGNAYMGRAAEITQVIFAGQPTSIGDCAFRGLTALASITVPESVTAVGEQAFDGCAALEEIYFEGAAPAADAAFGSAAPTLRYIEGMAGWTDGEGYDAAADTWNGYALESWGKRLEEENPVLCDALITVRDGVCHISAVLTALDEDANIYFAHYDENGRLVDVDLKTILAQSVERTVDYTLSGGEGESVKLFVLGDTSETPCADAVGSELLAG